MAEPAPPAPDAAAAPPTLEERLAVARAEAEELRGKWLRARADYDNLQKRTARDAALERDRVRARLLEGFLPLLELSHMAVHQAESHPGPLSEGVVMLGREFERFAEREGLARTGAVGEKADPTVHEILAEEPAPGVASGHVSRVVQSGWLLDGKVLRFAKVAVAPAPAAAPSTPSPKASPHSQE